MLVHETHYLNRILMLLEDNIVTNNLFVRYKNIMQHITYNLFLVNLIRILNWLP